MTRFIIFLIITGALYSKEQLLSNKLEASSRPHGIDTSFYAVLPYSNSMYWMFKNVKPAALSGREIDSLEVIIAQAVGKYNSSLMSSAERLHPLIQYKRQYVAVTNKNGQKEVWINLFCHVGNAQWRKNIVTTDDGGSCFFTLVVNLNTRRYYHLYVNGDA